MSGSQDHAKSHGLQAAIQREADKSVAGGRSARINSKSKGHDVFKHEGHEVHAKSTKDSFVDLCVSVLRFRLRSFDGSQCFFRDLEVMEYFLHVIQFFNALDGPHHLKRGVHIQFEFLFGDHAQTGFLGRDMRPDAESWQSF